MKDTVGKTIKKIRQEHNLSQKEFADIFNVSYQAVSKWENDKNMPDLIILKEICKKYNYSLDEFLDNKRTSKKNIIFMAIMFFVVVIFMLLLVLFLNRDNFEFKTLSTSCDVFKVTGSIAYNKDKTSIYISHITYCGGDDDTIYDEITCHLYENDESIIKEISSCKKINDITLEDFLKNLTFNVNHYDSTCKLYKENSLYLEIEAKDEKDKVISYKIPLVLEDNCN